MDTGTSGQPTGSLCGSPLPPAVRMPVLSFVLYEDAAPSGGLRETIASLRAQDYPYAEFIVVIKRTARNSMQDEFAGDPRFTALMSDSGSSPMQDALLGLDHAKGEFICFLDSSVTLFPEFASMHVQAQIGARSSVAMSVARASGFVPGVNGGFTSPGNTGVMREPDVAPRVRSVTEAAYESLMQAVHISQPGLLNMLWVKRPPQVYRRFVLDLARPMADAETLALLDVEQHFLPLCHFLGGSMLIDLPMSRDLVPGRNGTELAGDPANLPLRQFERARVCFERAERLRTHVALRLIDIALLSIRDGNKPASAALAHPLVAELFARNWPGLVEMFGVRNAVERFHRMENRHTLQRLLRLAYPGKPASRAYGLILWLDIRRSLRRLAARLS